MLHTESDSAGLSWHPKFKQQRRYFCTPDQIRGTQPSDMSLSLIVKLLMLLVPQIPLLSLLLLLLPLVARTRGRGLVDDDHAKAARTAAAAKRRIYIKDSHKVSVCLFTFLPAILLAGDCIAHSASRISMSLIEQ